jgi:outer membrane immunogenic protein
MKKGLLAKKSLLSATALSALSVSALAADLPLKAAAPAAKPVAAVNEWAGFYVGAHAGYAWIKPRYDETNCCALNPTIGGGVFGAYAGVNFQSGRFVYGLEGDVGAATHSKELSNGYSKISMPWNAHVRGRFGYVVDQYLLFAAAGLAVAHFKYDDTDPGWGEFSKTLTGLSVGGGAERKLSQNWVARIEYLYDHFGSATKSLDDPNIPDRGKGYFPRIRPNVHTVRAGLARKF